jgi:RNA polymerase sigma-70 factor (ECF subfamily)
MADKDKNEQTDEELVAAYVDGQENAFGQLVARHLSGVYTFALRLVGDEHAAEDIAQEVFLKTWKSIYRYNPESSKFKTWILRIARNTAIDYLRKRKHIPFSEFSSTRDEEDGGGANLLADVIPDPNPLPEELFARTEDAEMVIHSVEMLSPRHREVLTLHYTNHLTFEEIGRMLGQPTNTVKSRHHRALIALRTLLAPKDHE